MSSRTTKAAAAALNIITIAPLHHLWAVGKFEERVRSERELSVRHTHTRKLTSLKQQQQQQQQPTETKVRSDVSESMEKWRRRKNGRKKVNGCWLVLNTTI